MTLDDLKALTLKDRVRWSGYEPCQGTVVGVGPDEVHILWDDGTHGTFSTGGVEYRLHHVHKVARQDAAAMAEPLARDGERGAPRDG
jgi:hypothetical protein